MFSETVQRRLRSIVEDADHINTFTADLNLEAFRTDVKAVFAVERLLQRITEAVIQIGADEMARVDAGIQVAHLRAFGNRLRHEYDSIDRARVFAIARDDVPALRDAAARALDG